MSTHQGTHTPARRPPKRAGVFDIRTVIGLLLGIYGVVLIITGLLATSAEDLSKTDGTNVNLWTGIGLLTASAAFFAWARLRPVVVPADVPSGEEGERS